MTSLKMMNLNNDKNIVTNRPQIKVNDRKQTENLLKIETLKLNDTSQEILKTMQKEFVKKFDEIEEKVGNKLNQEYSRKIKEIEAKINNIETRIQKSENKVQKLEEKSEKEAKLSKTIENFEERIQKIKENFKINFSNLQTSLEDFSKSSLTNFTNFENLLIKNEEKVEEILDELDKYERIEEKIQRNENEETKLAIRIDEIEIKFKNDEIKNLKEKVDKIQKELELFNTQSNKKNLNYEIEIENEEKRNLKIEELEHKNEKLEKETKILVYSGISFLSISLTLIILFCFIVILRKNENSKSNEKLENSETKDSTDLVPFTIFDNDFSSNPFKNDFCIDGTQMYDNVEYENWPRTKVTTFGDSQNFYVNRSTENILDESECF